ncbi:MAG: putative Alkaline phosphatase [Modestobacter sp.]|nr:putative Alkaline phosphatase [Modestobacter sp.]
MPTAAAADPGGLTGIVLDAMDSLGALGVGLAILAETVIPPIPSEVVLPIAGYLAQTGRMHVVAVFLAATLGSLVGAALLYELGRVLGPERSRRVLGRLPLVDVEDVEKTFAWFERHGRSAVLIGRLVPVVRSFVSVPAGVVRMPWPQFLLYTAIGSALWNGLLIGAGMALGTQYEVVESYVGYLDWVLVAAAVGAVGWALVRHVRRRRSTLSG